MNGIRQLLSYRQNRHQEFLAATALQRLQIQKLQGLLQHAYNHVPFHRRRLEVAGIAPGDIRSLADLAMLPLLTKQELQQNPLTDLLATGTNLAVCRRVTTSGSTGTPLQLCFQRLDHTRSSLDWLRPPLAAGIKPWHRRFQITGAHNIPGSKPWYEHLGLWRQQSVSIFSTPEHWFAELCTYRPDYLWAYGGALRLLGDLLEEKGLQPPPLKAVFAVSDATDNLCRELVAKAWHLPVTDIYGAAEAGCIAWQCHACGAYHVNSDNVIVEIVDDSGNPLAQGSGRVIVTNLNSSAMPIIRYDLGDIASWSKTAPVCGRFLPLLEGIAGRSDAFLQLPSGRRLAPLFLDNIFKHRLQIRNWRAVQQPDGSVLLSFVCREGFSSHELQRLQKEIEGLLPEPLSLRLELVAVIPALPSGKNFAVLSLLRQDNR
jgi:phenylacetate-CoA ligase